MRRALLLSLLLIGFVAGRAPEAQGMWIARTFFELLQSSDDVLVIHVDSTGGPRYGEWAQVSVRRSFKGTVPDDTIRLPFEYQDRPSPGRSGRVWRSTALDRSFEAGRRLLVLVTRRPLPDTTGEAGRWNPYGAATRYRVYPYPSNTRFDLASTTAPIEKTVERLLRADRAEAVSVQAAALRPLLQHDDPTIRRYAAGAAAHLAPEPLAPLLVRRFQKEEDQRIRRHITKALTPLDHSDITPALLGAAPDYEPALTALGRRTDAPLAEPLMRMYEALPDTTDRGLRIDLFRALSTHAGPEHVPTFIRWYEAAESADRWDPILHLIGATQTAEGTAFVGQVLATGASVARRVEAAEVAKQRSLDSLAPQLLRRFETEPNAKVRRAITAALAELEHPEITPTLLDAAPTDRPALRALAHRPDTTLAGPLIRLYDTVADTAGPERMGALRSALDTHLSPDHSSTVARWYRQAETTERKKQLLLLMGPMKTPTSDSLLAHVLTNDSPLDLQRSALSLIERHRTHRPDALVHVLRHVDRPGMRRAALHALGASGYLSALDDITDYAPPPCAVPASDGVFEAAWRTIAGWVGQTNAEEAPWTPDVLRALREMGQVHVEHPQPVMDALVPYLSCRRFDDVPILAAKALFAMDPVSTRTLLRKSLAQEQSARVRREFRHLVWVGSQIAAE
jgi:HEAT repeat protein